MGPRCANSRPRGSRHSSHQADCVVDELARTDREPHQRLFGARTSTAFSAEKLAARADKAWDEAGLTRITLHECRHTFASLMIAAGVNAKAPSTFMGHSAIAITMDRYGHMMPGSEAEAAGLLDTYLAAERERQEEAARAAGGDLTGEQTGERAADDGAIRL